MSGGSAPNTSKPSTSGTSKSARTLRRPGSSVTAWLVPRCGQGRLSSKRVCPPSQQSYNERRKAYKVLERVGSMPIQDRTEANLQSLEWAKKVIDDHDKKKILASKWQRLTEEESQVVKRPKIGITSTIKKYSEVLKQAITSSRPRARASAPSSIGEADRILQIIRISNPDLPTQSWKIWKLEDSKGEQKQVLLLLDRESILARTHGVISFGLGAIIMKVYRKDEVGTEGEKVENVAQCFQPDPECRTSEE